MSEGTKHSGKDLQEGEQLHRLRFIFDRISRPLQIILYLQKIGKECLVQVAAFQDLRGKKKLLLGCWVLKFQS